MDKGSKGLGKKGRRGGVNQVESSAVDAVPWGHSAARLKDVCTPHHTYKTGWLRD